MYHDLTISEISLVTHYHPNTIRKLDRNGILPAKRDRFGNRRWSLTQVLEFLRREREAETKSEDLRKLLRRTVKAHG